MASGGRRRAGPPRPAGDSCVGLLRGAGVRPAPPFSRVVSESPCVPVAFFRAAGSQDELGAVGGRHGRRGCAQRTVLELDPQRTDGYLLDPSLGGAAVAAPELDLGAAGGAVASVVEALAVDADGAVRLQLPLL